MGGMKVTDKLPPDLVRGPHGEDETVVLRIGTTELELVGALRDAVLTLVSADATGLDVAELPAELTTGQAADMLGVSRPTVVQLIERGALPARRVGSRRRLATVDVLAYRRECATVRRSALREMAAVSEELGLYR